MHEQTRRQWIKELFSADFQPRGMRAWVRFRKRLSNYKSKPASDHSIGNYSLEVSCIQFSYM